MPAAASCRERCTRSRGARDRRRRASTPSARGAAGARRRPRVPARRRRRAAIAASVEACGARVRGPRRSRLLAGVRPARRSAGRAVRARRAARPRATSASRSSGRDVRSPLGREVAADLGRGLVRAGAVRGERRRASASTRAAHRGALDGGGRTVAVLGSGIDVTYPRDEPRAAGARSRSHGTLVSEYPPGVPAEPYRFPARNRLIAGARPRGRGRRGRRARAAPMITVEHARDLGLRRVRRPGPGHEPARGDAARADPRRRHDDPRRRRPARRPGPRLRSRRAGRAGRAFRPTSRRVFDALRAPMLPDAVARARRDCLVRRGRRRAGPPGAPGARAGVGGRYERTFGRGPVAEAPVRPPGEPRPPRAGDCAPSRPLGGYAHPDRKACVTTRDELPPSDDELLDAFADHLRLERRLSPNTVAAYGRDLAQLAVFLHRGGSSLAGRRPTRCSAGSWRSSTRWAARAPRSRGASARSAPSTGGRLARAASPTTRRCSSAARRS